jgi:hypothetical protein
MNDVEKAKVKVYEEGKNTKMSKICETQENKRITSPNGKQ